MGKRLGKQTLTCWYCKTGRTIEINEVRYGDVIHGKSRAIKPNIACSSCGNYMPHQEG